jgi:hypothetical protein
MIIGLDLDNTIACYDGAIATLAAERLVLPPGVALTKITIREHLRAAGREPEWTEFQAYLYGPGMEHAAPFPGAVAAIAALAANGHRTRRPYRGPAFDLHAAARDWITRCLAISAESVFLEESRDAKIARIAALKCDVFVDDLPEVLSDPKFPPATRRLLFRAGTDHDGEQGPAGVEVLATWDELRGRLGL